MNVVNVSIVSLQRSARLLELNAELFCFNCEVAHVYVFFFKDLLRKLFRQVGQDVLRCLVNIRFELC